MSASSVHSGSHRSFPTQSGSDGSHHTYTLMSRPMSSMTSLGTLLEEEDDDDGDGERHSRVGSLIERKTVLQYVNLQRTSGQETDAAEQAQRSEVDFLDSDLNELFAGTLEGTVPTLSSEFSPCSPLCILAIHAGGVFLFIIRFFIAWLYRGALTTELLKCLGMICAYVVLGIVMPQHASSLIYSGPVRRIITIREAYRHHSLEHKGIRSMARYFYVMQPFAVALATVPPITSLIQVLCVDTDAKGSYLRQPLSMAIFAAGTTWFLLMTAFGATAVELVSADSSEVCVKGLASDLKNDRSIDWASVHRRCVKLQDVLASLWDIPNVGGLWLARVLILFIASLTIGAISLHHPNLMTRTLLRVLAAGTAVTGSYLLLHIALITLKCHDSRPGSESIMDISLRMGGKVKESDLLEYQCFMSYLQISSFGVQIRGIPISLRLVGVMFLNMVATLQIALLFTEHILFPRDI